MSVLLMESTLPDVLLPPWAVSGVLEVSAEVRNGGETDLLRAFGSVTTVAHSLDLERSLIRERQVTWPRYPESETRSVYLELNSLLKELQELGVKLLNQKEINEYLLSFPDLIEVTRRAVFAALRHMPDAQLVMKVYQDPEIEDRYLAIYARFEDYDESTLERIEAAESEYIELLSDRDGWIQLSTDFREPESA